MLDLAVALGADYVELASTQYYGWALLNRDHLLPTREQVLAAEAVTQAYRERVDGRMRIFWVVTDYHEGRPKPCMNGWGQVFLSIAPDGTALPCQAAHTLSGLDFPNVKDHSLEWIWRGSPAFNRFRGYDWMKPPCHTCPEREKDFGGCRCQAYALTGDPANADPVCALSPHHRLVRDAVAAVDACAGKAPNRSLLFRHPRNSRDLSGGACASRFHDDPRESATGARDGSGHAAGPGSTAWILAKHAFRPAPCQLPRLLTFRFFMAIYVDYGEPWEAS